MNHRLLRSRHLTSIIEGVGNTPLLRLKKVAAHVPDVEVYVKLEFMNPGGSVKDRPALRMMLDAIADGRLTKDKILIDATSGNTGVAYSMIGAALGYRVQLVMPKNVSKARKDITQAYGTELVFSSPMEGSDGAIRLVRKLVEENPDKYFYSDQYSNPSNPLAHYLGTGQEIPGRGRRQDHPLRRSPRDERHGDGHHAPPPRAPPEDPLRRRRTRRGDARARRPQAHGLVDRPRDL